MYFQFDGKRIKNYISFNLNIYTHNIYLYVDMSLGIKYGSLISLWSEIDSYSSLLDRIESREKHSSWRLSLGYALSEYFSSTILERKNKEQSREIFLSEE